MNATMAKFVEMEQAHGSLIIAGEKKNSNSDDRKASGARYGLFRSPEFGMGQLVDWIVEALDRVEVRTNCSVTEINKDAAGWSLKFQGRVSVGTSSVAGVVKTSGNNQPATDPETIQADGVVIATSAKVAGNILNPIDSTLADRLKQIKAASSAIVILAVDASQIERQFDGYGIIVPAILNRKVIATSFSSNKFAGRAPDGKILIRTFIGGALQSELVELSDEELVAIATDELKKTVGFEGEPEFSSVHRWRNCMPQYHLGHLELLEEIDALIGKQFGIEIAGNSYRGVGVPACIQSGYEAIKRLVVDLTGR